MKTLLKSILLAGLLLVPQAANAIDSIKAGVTSSIEQCVNVFIADSTATDGSGLTGLTQATAGTCSYRRADVAAPVNMTLVAGTVGSFTANGFIQVDATDQPGVYQICLPNAAVATGAKTVIVACTGATNAADMTLRVLLSPSVNVSTIDTAAIEEQDFAPTNLFGAGSTTTLLQLAAGETSNDITGQSICATSGVASKTCRPVTAYNTGTKVATVSPAYTNAPANNDGYSIGNYTAAGAGGCPTAADIWTYVSRTLTGTQTFSNTGTWTGNVTGNLSGSVGSVTGAVGSVTGAVGSVTGAVGSVTGNVGGNVVGNVNGNVVGSIGSFAAGSINLASFASDVLVFPVKTAQSATTTQVVLANSETFGTNTLNNNNSVHIFSSTNGIKQVACIKTYTSGTKVAVLTVPFAVAPTGTIRYAILPSPNCNMTLWPQSH